MSAFPATPDLGETAASFNRIVTAADAAGYDNPNVDYTMFYDGDGDFGACGVAFLWGDDSLTADNANNNPSGFAAGYAVSFAGCWYGLASMHENGHAEGAVQAAAPNSTGSGGHCNEAVDVMCYLDGGDINQDYPQPCASPDPAPIDIHFDCGFNTYFDAAPEPGEWLASHWNLGSTLSRFIRFGGPQPPSASIGSGPSGVVSSSTAVFGFSSCSARSAPSRSSCRARISATISFSAVGPRERAQLRMPPRRRRVRSLARRRRT